RLKNRCKRLWQSAVITNSGDVLPCCFDQDADYVSGNMQEMRFSDINNNPESVNFRKKLLTNRKQIDICRNCTEGLRL
ncbi:MAG: radical SAM protein, partial [Bacteroidetes bacterium]